MKKFLVTILVVLTMVSVLVGCSSLETTDDVPVDNRKEISENQSDNTSDEGNKVDDIFQTDDETEEERDLRTMPELTSENVAEYIVGEWKLLSYVNGRDTVDYSEQERIWSFDGREAIVDSNEFGGAISSNYSVRQAQLRSDVCIVVQLEGIKNSHMPYGKFIVTSIEDDILTIIDWFGDIIYTLEYVGE